jgi:ABC-2 type transport system permease protein
MRRSGPSPLRHWLRVLRVLLGSQYALMLEYRAEIALWALSGLLPLIMLGLWSGSEAATAAGIAPTQLARYFLAAFVVRQFTVVWMIHAFEEDNLEGRLSPYLLQPLPPLLRYLAAHLAEQVTRLPFVALMLLLLAPLLPAAFHLPPPTDLLLGLLALEMAFILRFLLQTLVASLCFWSERAAALDRLLLIPYLFLSGLVAPLETFPAPVRTLALLTPFPWMVAFPARLLAGQGAIPLGVEGSTAAGFGVTAAWLLLLVPPCRGLWRAGLRRYAAMGA